MLFYHIHIVQRVHCYKTFENKRQIRKRSFKLMFPGRYLTILGRYVGFIKPWQYYIRAWSGASKWNISMSLNIMEFCQHLSNQSQFKGIAYYEIVYEARPLWGFSPHMLIFLRKCISNHETKQASKFQSDPSANCFTIDVFEI